MCGSPRKQGHEWPRPPASGASCWEPRNSRSHTCFCSHAPHGLSPSTCRSSSTNWMGSLATPILISSDGESHGPSLSRSTCGPEGRATNTHQASRSPALWTGSGASSQTQGAGPRQANPKMCVPSHRLEAAFPGLGPGPTAPQASARATAYSPSAQRSSATSSVCSQTAAMQPVLLTPE